MTSSTYPEQPGPGPGPPSGYGGFDSAPRPASLAEVLELVLDKGVVIAGDIKINLLEIELLTIKLRLLIASVDRAREMGINWWESDPTLTSGPASLDGDGAKPEVLGQRIEALERRLAELTGDSSESQQRERKASR